MGASKWWYRASGAMLLGMAVGLGACKGPTPAAQPAGGASSARDVASGVPGGTAGGGVASATAGSSAAGGTASAASLNATTSSRPLPSVAGAGDSLRGVVQRTGAEPQTQLTVRAANGATCVLHFPATAPAIDGMDVALWGTRGTGAPPTSDGSTCALTVARYAVRAVDGIPAVDGILLVSETSYALDLANGSRPHLTNVPSTLKGQVGARIFWAGSLDRAPMAYGVLEPARR